QGQPAAAHRPGRGGGPGGAGRRHDRHRRHRPRPPSPRRQGPRVGPGRDGHDRTRDGPVPGAADHGRPGPAQLAGRRAGAVREARPDRPRYGAGAPPRARQPGPRPGLGPAPGAGRRSRRPRLPRPQLALRGPLAAGHQPPDRARRATHGARRPSGAAMSERLVPVLLVVAALAAMAWGWRRRGRSQQHLPVPTDRSLADLGEGIAHGPVDAVYVDTVLAEQPLERIVAHGLGQRAKARVSLGDGGSYRIEREGAPDLTVPSADLAEVTSGPGMAGK